MKRFSLLLVLLSLASVPHVDAQMRGYPYAPRLNSYRIGVGGGVGVLGGDLTKESNDYHYRPVANLEVAHILHRNIVLGFYGGVGDLRSTNADMESNTRFLTGGMLLELRIPLLRGSIFPIMQLRGGGARIEPVLRSGQMTFEGQASSHATYGVAAGIEAISWHQLGIRMLFGVTYTTADRWDLLVRGDDKDGYSYATLSLHYYFTFRR